MRMTTFNEMYGPSGYTIARTGKHGAVDQYTVFKDGVEFVKTSDIEETVSEVEYVFVKKSMSQFG